MPKLHIKKGVDLNGTDTAMVRAWATIADIYDRHGCICRLTSGKEGEHMEESLHYVGRANDFGIRHDGPTSWDDFDEITIDNIYRDLKATLGDDYDVVKETSHIHIEYDPK